MNKDVNLLSDNISSIFFTYLIPSVGGMLGTSLYVLGDTMIVGRGLGSQGLAALNISIPIINVFNGFGLLFGIGGATALSISRGRGNYDKVNDIFTKSIIMSFLIGVVLTLVRIFYLEELALLLGASGKTLKMSMDYLGVLMSFSIAFLLNSSLTVFVRNDGAPRLAMWGVLSGSIINVILDYVFIMKFNWGMWGGALATGLSPVIGLLILSSHFIKGQNQLKFILAKLDLSLVKRIISNGAASFIIELSAGIVIFTFNKTILRLVGDIGVSAYSIIANLSLICTAIFMGIGQGIQPIVSINYGANQMERVYEAARLAIYSSLVLGLIFYIIGAIFPSFLVSIFTYDQSDLLDITVRGIRLYFISFIFMGINITITSYIQSKEKVKTSMLISIARGLILIIICLWTLPKLIGLDGVWLTMPLVELVTLVLSSLYISKYREVLNYSFRLNN